VVRWRASARYRSDLNGHRRPDAGLVGAKGLCRDRESIGTLIRTVKAFLGDRSRRATLAAVLVWLLWAANAVNDLVQDGRLSPFTVVMLVALLGGQVLVWLGIVSNPMPRRWASATFAIVGAVILGVAAYLLVAALT